MFRGYGQTGSRRRWIVRLHKILHTLRVRVWQKIGLCLEFLRYFHDNKKMEEKDVVKALAALAQPSRLRVFRALVVCGKEGATPGALVDTLEVPAATLSFHLKELLNAGLVSQERSGRNLIYRAEYARMNEVLSYLTSNCCQGVPCLDESATMCGC